MEKSAAPADTGMWVRVPGNPFPAAGVSAWIRLRQLSGQITWPAERDAVKLNETAPYQRPQTPPEEPTFDNLLAAIGLGKVLWGNPAEPLTLLPETDFVLSNGSMGHPQEQGAVISGYTVLLEYRIENHSTKRVKLLRASIKDEAQKDAVLILQHQRYGSTAPKNAACILAAEDRRAAAAYIESKKSAFKQGGNLLFLKLDGCGSLPIIEADGIEPDSDVKEFHLALWNLFGLSVFQSKGFIEALSDQQKALKSAYESEQPDSAMRYLLSYHKIIKYGPGMVLLSFDGIPESDEGSGRLDIQVLIERFSKQLRSLLLENPEVRPAVLLRVQPSVEISWDSYSGRWDIPLAGTPLFRRNDCRFVELLGLKKKEMFFLKEAHRVDSPTGVREGEGCVFSYEHMDTIHGVAVPEGGWCAADKHSLLLAPRPDGMSLVVLVVKDAEPDELIAVGCFVSPRKMWAIERWLRTRFGWDMPVCVENESDRIPEIVAGIDSEGTAWAFAILDPVDSREVDQLEFVPFN